MEGLKHESHMPAADRGPAVFAEGGQIHARDQHAAGARRIESGEQRQKRGLAGAGSADDGETLAGSHNQAHIGENGERPFRARNGFRYIPGLENDFV